MTDAILFINRSDSKFGSCNRAADPSEETHEMGGTGCGARFTILSSNYYGLDYLIRLVRPDLPFAPQEAA